MPIKPFKGFARRKSSGNVLEDVEHAPQPSFRVFERPSTGRKSLSDGNLLSQTAGDRAKSYSPPEDDNIFVGSDGPTYRNLTGGNASEGPAGRRFSSSNRRSTDIQTHFDSQSPHKNIHDVPVPPLTNALRAAGRTFSFGGRFSKTPAQPPNRPSSPDTTHSRGTTNSTTSTATPPKLLETEFQIGRMDDDFGNMFNDIGKQGTSEATQNSSNTTANNLEGYPKREEKSPRPAPISTDRSKVVEPSPYSWGSRHSEEGLLAVADSPPDGISAYQAYSADQSMIPPPLGARRKSSPMFDAVPPNTTTHRSLEKPKMATDKGLRRSVLFSSKRNTGAVEDEDAKLVTASFNSNKSISQAHNRMASADFDVDDDVPLFGPSNTVKTISGQREYLPTSDTTNDHIDSSIAAHARLAAEYENKPAPAPSTNKVMTPSQFEHYRQQQELKRANSDASSSEDSDGSEFDEEDEAEKNREIERQRRKQEAHMSVYRQQMMKVTGQQAPSPSLRPDERASTSTPNLANRSLHPGNPSGSRKSSEGDADEDEEIPLGILAAHGFPSRNRPPSRLMSSNSMSNLNASYQQPHLGSAGSDIGGGNRSSLPVFARNLPRDPYFGASLVTPSNRESLALGGGGGGGSGSVYGGPPAAAGSSSALPPGGLVGVIATEERARAMRRGSPNTQAMYDHQPALSGPMGGMPGGIPRPHTMLGMNSAPPPNPQPTISATEQAQIQLSQQMSSMMQMQMQWMQQMIQVQGGQAPSQQLASPNFPMSFPNNTNGRPSSMPSVGGAMSNAPPAGYGGSQRTLSMLDPNVSSRLNSPAGPFVPGANRPGTPGGGGYAPSLAPSERSNVGLSARYRPVSTVPAEAESAGLLPPSKAWNDENRRSTFLAPPTNAKPHNTTIRPVSSYGRMSTAPSKLNRHVHVQPDDDDDDEGWAQMALKREKKRTNWKAKKESPNFGDDLLNAVH
ncbi:uncharacterized protein BDV17DRAFT_286441 [Aspergillus undulatus]|uniref:uncharacterized protein n=1 Tax=Aspergillus undulatus TaxID=1810928 RepID=UPI003CCD4022